MSPNDQPSRSLSSAGLPGSIKHWSGTVLEQAGRRLYTSNYVTYVNNDGLANRLRLHVVRPKENSRATVAGMQDALIDLLMLAACDVIIATPNSSFSEFAAFLSGRPMVAATENGWKQPLERALTDLRGPG